MGLSSDPEKRKRQLANLRPQSWKKGQTGNPKGYHRISPLTAFIKQCEGEYGMDVPSATEISKTYLYVSSLNEERLKELLKDKQQPMFLRVVAKSVLGNKGIDILERIINRAYGSKQQIDITTNGKDLQREPLQIHYVNNSEEYNKILSEIEEEKQKKDAAFDNENMED